VNGVFVEDQAKVLSERFDVLVFTQRIYDWRDALRGRIPSGTGFVMREGVRVYEQKVFIPPGLSRRAALAYRFQHFSGQSASETSSGFSLRAEMAYRFERARAAMVSITRSWGVPEILHTHTVLPGGWIGTRLGRALNVPVVLTEHTGPFSAHLTSDSQQVLVKETLQSCAKVIAVSPSLAHQIEQVDPLVPIEILGNVIPTRFFYPAESLPAADSQGALLLLFSVSLLTREKGYEYLLRAARMLIDNGFQRFELHIGGDGPDKPRLESLIRDLNLQDVCRLLGMLRRDKVRDWMRRCDLFVLPSMAETFGVVIGEAMACGKPVLSTHCGGADFQVLPETGILVAPGDASALADGIKRLASERLRYSPEVIRDAVVRRFGEAAFLEEITRKYHDAISGSIARPCDDLPRMRVTQN